MQNEPKYPDVLVWVDLETTGLDPVKDDILELGFLITDSRGVEKARASWVLRYTKPLEGWPLEQHTKSGLLEECQRSPFAEHDLIEIVPEFLNAFYEPRKVPMCGASVHFDRAFLRQHMPEIEKWFYYGNLDVSSIEKVAQLWYPELPKWEDRGLHRVDPDNEDSVAELLYYRDNIFQYEKT